jgi:hypothetical protein
MSPIEDGRSDFRDRVDKQPNPNWPPLPLTHIANALVAADIAKSDFVHLVDCKVFGKPLAYFFYGRPAYRVSGRSAHLDWSALPASTVRSPPRTREQA